VTSTATNQQLLFAVYPEHSSTKRQKKIKMEFLTFENKKHEKRQTLR